MDKYLDILMNVPLFKDIAPIELTAMLKCLNSEKKTYTKNEILLNEGQPFNKVGIMLEGEIHIIKEDYTGNKSIIAELNSGEIFAESFVCAGLNISPVTIICANKATVLFIDYKKVITLCSSACVFHSKLIDNMLKVIALRNLSLNHKIELLCLRTTREKVLFYLASLKSKNSTMITIPFSREELADYLCVNRSALSKELGKLNDEGIISFYKNTFKLENIESLSIAK